MPGRIDNLEFGIQILTWSRDIIIPHFKVA